MDIELYFAEADEKGTSEFKELTRNISTRQPIKSVTNLADIVYF